MRLGLGPVFVYEWLRIARRWQLYAARSGFVAILLIGLWLSWESWSSRADGYRISELAAFGRAIYATLAVLELSLVLLAAPAATAGAVCLDKARGSLLQVMTTDLSDTEIVLGKLAASLLPVAGLIFGVLPVLMLSSLLGGVDPAILLASFAVCLGTGALVCTLAFLLSVWGTKTHEVLGATYLALVAVLALGPLFASLVGHGPWRNALPEPITNAAVATLDAYALVHPYVLLFPTFNEPAEWHLYRALYYLGGCLVATLFLVVLAIATIRGAALRHGGGGGRGVRRRAGRGRARLIPWPVPSLDSNPVLWREWSRNRPSKWGRFVWGSYGLFGLLFTLGAIAETSSWNPRPPEFGIMAAIYIVGLGLLFMSVKASTALSEERIRGSLDVLLTTSLTTPEILAGKWWGTFRDARVVVGLPTLIGFAQALASGRWAHFACYVALLTSYAAVVASVGLAIAVWVSRPGRAVALAVGSYVLACIGWPIVVAWLVRGPEGMAVLASPPFGATIGLIAIASGHPGTAFSGEYIGPALAWSVGLGLTALACFATACGAFDRKMGRIPDFRDPGGLATLLPLIPRFAGRTSRAAATEGKAAGPA